MHHLCESFSSRTSTNSCQCGCSVEEVPSFEAKAERLEPLLAILLSGLVYLQTFSITCWHSRKVPARPSFIIQGGYNVNPKCGAKSEPWRVAQGFFNVLFLIRSPLEVEQVAPVLCLGLNGKKKSPEPELLVRKCCTCLVKGKLTGRCFPVLTGTWVTDAGNITWPQIHCGVKIYSYLSESFRPLDGKLL